MKNTKCYVNGRRWKTRLGNVGPWLLVLASSSCGSNHSSAFNDEGTTGLVRDDNATDGSSVKTGNPTNGGIAETESSNTIASGGKATIGGVRSGGGTSSTGGVSDSTSSVGGSSTDHTGGASGGAGTSSCGCAMNPAVSHGVTHYYDTTLDCLCPGSSWCDMKLEDLAVWEGERLRLRSPMNQLRDYPDCNWVVVLKTSGSADPGPASRWVFNRSTGQLVGVTFGGDSSAPCPVDATTSMLAVWLLRAGTIPDETVCLPTICTGCSVAPYLTPSPASDCALCSMISSE